MPASDAVDGILPEKMSHQQWHVYRLAVWEGRSLFYTGKAGTGKSSLLASILRDLGRPAAVLAPTGTAAVNIGPMATTIHSFAVRDGCTCVRTLRTAPTPPPRPPQRIPPRFGTAAKDIEALVDKAARSDDVQKKFRGIKGASRLAGSHTPPHCPARVP